MLKNKLINDYDKKYYIKNSKNHIEFYQPSNSNRYVTITGRTIYNNKINYLEDELYKFLDLYMKRKEVYRSVTGESTNEISFDMAVKKIKFLYYKDNLFQELWFGKAPGSGKDESERDFQILEILYNNITTDRNMLRELFETSPYYKSKDSKHVYKWKYNNYRYFNFVYDRL